MATIGKNQFFEIKNGDGSSFHNLVLRKSAVESIVMSLGDKISGDVYYKDNTLSVTMHEYITYNGVNYMLINPPTIVREGVVSDNSELRGMTKYSFVFYHPMCQLSNFPFTDVAVTNDETRYLSESKIFSWIGKPADFVAKMNKNLDGTEWIVEISSRFPQDKLNELSDVIPFDNATIADACKTFYDTWGVPYVVDKVASTEASYATGKRFKLVMGLPSNEIYENASAEQQNIPFVFQMGHGVGLKNNSRTPRNNKIITRISGYGSENNIPYGYPQVRWYGTAGQSFTYGDHAGVYTNVTIGGVHFDKVVSYPIYKGILNGEYVELIKHPFTRTHLMPSVYRTTLFNKISLYNDLGEVNTDYDPDITLVDFYDAVYSSQYPYPNTINLQAPSYESHEFEDEKPELGEAHIISATPLNNDLTPASSWDDSLDDEGNYNQSYFQIVLPRLTFDLYACASITEEMQITMRSGACLGCTFTAQIDWDDYKRNFYDEDGNFAPNGSQRDLTKYPKSNQGSISLILQKDNTTFGTLMPNMYQYPKGETSTGANDGDTFVILGISLPESYILAAEDRLDVNMKSYMLENNEHYFDYPLKFDEDFLFHNENILSQIRPNTVVRFNYAGQTQALFVKQITIKYGEQQLPQYDITLTDNVEVVLNQIGQVAEDVEKLSTLIAILRQSYGKNVWNELAKKLSKTQDDTAAGYITMLKGLQVGANFVPDILGEGGVLRMRDDGKVELVTDILYARVKAYFDSVEIREYQHTGGNRIASVAGNKICRVAWFNSSNVELEQTQANLANVAYFRCYFRASDGEDTVKNNWVIGDQAYCHITSVTTSSDNPEEKGLNQKHLWRLVIGRNTEGTLTEDGEAYIDLSNRSTETISGTSYTGYQSGSDAPEAQDDIIQLGNVNDTTRQGAIVEFVTGTDAPSYQIYQSINSFSLNNKNQIGFGYNTSTGRAYLNVYGDAYIGARDRSTFIEYKQDDGTQQHAPVLNIKAKIQTLPNSTYEGKTASQFVQDNQVKYDTDIQNLTNITNDLQSQIDGEIVSWFYEGTPTLDNAPAVDWNTDTLKERHLGDMYYDVGTGVTSGFAYRFIKSEQGVYSWQYIDDTAITLALAKAAEALGLAGSKAKTYTTANNVLPSAPYNVGDLWLNATGTWGSGANAVTWENEILKCINACPADGTPDISDWAKASKYTDDSAFNGYINAFLNGTGASGDSATAAAIQKAIAGALGSGIIVDGGLLLTSLIGMRKNVGTTENPVYETWAGISGQYDDWTITHAKGHGIAAWYGGAMVDKEDVQTLPASYAKSLFRFDGSGYLASGNITWDEQGRVSIKDVTTIISSNDTDVLNELITFNNAFHFNLSQGTSTVLSIEPQAAFTNLYIRNTTNPNAPYHVATEDWVDDHYVSKTFFRQLFRAFKPNATAGQADVEVQPNTIDATISNIKAMVGFWTEQYVSALGNNSDGGGGGASVLYGLNDVTPNATGDGVMGAQDGYVLTYNGSTHHWYAAATAETYVLPQATANALGGIKIGYAASGKNYAIALDTNGKAYVNVPWTDHYDWGDITNTPTTIAGYGITDAYTKTEVDSLARLKSVALSSDGVLAFTLQDGSVSYVDLTHQHDFQEILERPTTLAGFGIDDAKIESGVITLGNNTITPVTSVAMTVPTGFSISGTPISKTGTLALSYSSGYEGFTTELKNMITALYSWFEIDSNGDIKTKDYTSNGTTKHRGFWSPSFISALGQGSDSGGGGQGDVTWELLQTQATDDRYIHLSYISAALESYLTTNNYVQSSDISDMATKTWVGNQGYLTQQSLSSYYTKSEVDALARLTNVAYSSDGILAFTHQDGSTTYADFTHEHSFLELLDRPTTIAGYEISDVYINNGVVYIGDNSITPVTSVTMTVPTGFSISGSPISKTGTLAVSYASGYEGFTTSLKEKIEALFSWFELDSDGNVKTKDYIDNGTTKHRGFWSESFISALGEGNDGGGGGQGDVTWALLASTATGGRTIDISYLTAALNGYATQSWVQSQGYITQTAVDVLEYLNTVTGGSDILTLTTNKGNSTIVDFTHNHEFLELTDRPTTIAGYGIEDAKIANGVITLGTNTITPLTSHQSVTNNNISVTWDTETTIATIGSTAIKIRIPANPDTNTWRNIFLDGTEKLTTDINTKGLNFVGDDKTTISFLAAGTEEGQSGNANYATLKISSTWRGIQDNLTSDSTTDSLSAKQGKNLKSSITTLEGYFTNGVAKKAEELNTSRSLWGQSFNGTADVSGNMSSVGDISFSASGKKIGNFLYFDTTNTRLGVNTSSPSYRLHVNGTFYASGNSSIGGTFGVTGATTLTGLLTANGGIAIASSKTLKIGDIYLAYDSTNNAIEVYKLDGTNHVAANLYARGGIAALGETSDGGGGGQGDVTWDLLAHTATNNRFIDSSYISGALAGYSPTSHTHTTTIAAAASGDTSQLTLAHGTKYKLTAGGTSYIFTMPSDNNSWRNVYVDGTEKLTTATNTKAINFVAGNNVSISFAAAGTGSGQSGNANYGTLTISATDTTYTLAGLMGSTAIGGTTQPIYWNGSAFANTTYTLGKSVPSDAVFTDHYAWSDITSKPLTLTKNTTGFSISGGTTSKTLTVSENYTLGAACAKGVTDNSSSTAVTSSDTNLITGRTLYYAGYVKSSGVTKISTSTGLTGGDITSTGTISINSTYQTYISHGESAYNSLSNYLPLTGGTITGLLTISSTGSNRATIHLISSADVPNDLYFGSNGSSHWSLTSRSSNEGNAFYLYNAINSTDALLFDKDSKASFSESVTAKSFIKTNGTSSQFLKADGSVDNNSYVTSSGVTSVATGTGLTGGTITSTGTISINSTYQDYISHGESAYNSLSNYLLLTGGTITGQLNIYASSGRSTLKVTTPSAQPCNLWLGSGGVDKWSLTCRASDESYNFDIYSNATGAANGGHVVVFNTDGRSHFYNTIHAALHLCVGSNLSTYDTGRAELDICSPNNVASELWYGVGGSRQWSMCCRPSGEGYIYAFYSLRSLTYMATLDHSGNFVANGGVTALSDARHKQVIRDTNLSVEQIANMPSVIFKWTDGKHDNKLHVGTLAQNWQQILPEVVLERQDEQHTLSLSYGVAALVAAITTARKVVDHEARIKALEKECERLRTENEFLKLKIA